MTPNCVNDCILWMHPRTVHSFKLNIGVSVLYSDIPLSLSFLSLNRKIVNWTKIPLQNKKHKVT